MQPLRIIFAGTPAFAVPTLQTLIDSPHHIVAVYTQPDRPAGRGRQLTKSPIKQLAEQYQLPICQPTTLKSLEEQQKIVAYQVDFMIVVAYGLLLPTEVLQAPKFGCINVHASLLPRWRGAAPIQHAILAGDEKTGVSIMQMDKGLDTGPVFCEEAIPILPVDTTKSLHDKLSHLGARLLKQVLSQIAAGTIAAIKQDDTQVTYANKISKEQAKINWRQSAVEINRVIRAFNPWPIAFTRLKGEMIRIWEVVAINEQMDVMPGTIVRVNKQGIDVTTSHGILRILKLQFAGGKILTVTEVLNAKRDLFVPDAMFES